MNKINHDIQPKNLSKTRFLLLLIFILSGFAGLIYQSVWSQYLGIFLGHAAYAQALVLAIFMGGMALGALIIARYSENHHNLIRKYAIIEGIIGILGITFHFIFNFFADFSYNTLIPLTDSTFAITLIRWFVAAILIIPQTILLGMTFPLMSSGLMRRFPKQDGSLLGGLYFTNSIGAAFGALTSAFILIPNFGLLGATVTAGMLNIVVAIVTYWLSSPKELNPPKIQTTPKDKSSEDVIEQPQNKILKLVLLSTALSGAASFAYEIIWIRMLGMAVGSTLHAFELMLASFIAGIAFGGLWVRKRADKTSSPLKFVGWMQIGMGISALFSLFIYANAFEWVGWLMQALTPTENGYHLYTLGTAIISIAIMMPAAFFAGTTLPLFTVALLKNQYGEKSVGQVYASNTLGSILGVFLSIYFLIPFLGLKLALILAAFIDMGIGLFLLRHQAITNQDFKKVGIAIVSVLASTALAMQVKFDPLKLTAGVFRNGIIRLDDSIKVLYYKDGKTASISVRLAPPSVMSIATNGKVDAGVSMDTAEEPSTDESTMVLLAALPLAIHNQPQNIGVIGFGSGMTTHTLLADKRVNKVDTIEIEESVVEASKLFGHRVERAYQDSRSNIIIDDAKSYFSGQKAKYDVIISEPSNPWISGIGALFAKEFYQFIPRHLNDNGLFVQWIQLYEINDELVSSILKGLTGSFSDYRAYVTGSDLIIIATPKGSLPKLQSDRVLNDLIGKDMNYQKIIHDEQLQAHQVADASILNAYANLYDIKTNSYYFPYLSLEAPKTRFQHLTANLLFKDLPISNNMALEALGIRTPLSKEVIFAQDSHLTDFENLTKIAWLIQGYITNQQYPDEKTDPALKYISRERSGLLISAGKNICHTSDTALESQFSDALSAVVDNTLPFLSQEGQQQLFINPNWLACAPQDISPEAEKIFTFLELLAQRQWNHAASLAQDWLQTAPKDSVWRKNFDAWMLNTILLNHARNNQWQQLIEAEKQLKINNADETLLIPMLLSLAKTKISDSNQKNQ